MDILGLYSLLWVYDIYYIVLNRAKIVFSYLLFYIELYRAMVVFSLFLTGE